MVNSITLKIDLQQNIYERQYGFRNYKITEDEAFDLMNNINNN